MQLCTREECRPAKYYPFQLWTPTWSRCTYSLLYDINKCSCIIEKNKSTYFWFNCSTRYPKVRGRCVFAPHGKHNGCQSQRSQMLRLRTQPMGTFFTPGGISFAHILFLVMHLMKHLPQQRAKTFFTLVFAFETTPYEIDTKRWLRDWIRNWS